MAGSQWGGILLSLLWLYPINRSELLLIRNRADTQGKLKITVTIKRKEKGCWRWMGRLIVLKNKKETYTLILHLLKHNRNEFQLLLQSYNRPCPETHNYLKRPF